MPESILEYLQATRLRYATQLYELADPEKRKPSYSIGGRSVDWVAYQRFLLEMIRDVDAQIAGEDEPATTITAIE